jgi:RNA polymerase sigma-B factor
LTSTPTGIDSADRRRDLFLEYRRSHNPEIRQQLVDAYSNLVHFLARKFANRGEPLEDIVQVGFIGLLQAIERFEPERGLEFTTFATPTIVGEIKRYFRDKSWAVRLPRRLQELNQRVRLERERLQNQLGRAPSVAELAGALGVTPEEVLEANEAGPVQHTVPLDAVWDAGSGSDSEGLSLAERLGGEDANLARVEIKDLLGTALTQLSPREREIMYLRFVEELPQSEVARRLGISQMHVSRLQRAAVDQLRRQIPADLGV